jgi:Glycosyltransferase family 87
MILSEDNRRRLRFAYLSALAVWTLMVFGQLFVWIHDNEMFAYTDTDKNTGQIKPYLVDFPIYCAAGKLAVMAMQAPTNIYDIPLQDRVLRSIIAPVVPEKPWVIQYPPPVFLFSAPLTLASMPFTWPIFCLIGDSLFLLSFYQFIKSDITSKKDFALLSLFICSSFPFWICNRMGQIALYTVPSTILFWTLIRTKRDLGAGFSTALLLMKFQYLPFIGAVGLVLGKVRFVVGGFIACSVILALCGFILGWQNITNYPSTMVPAEFATNLYTGINPVEQQNLRALLVRVSGNDSPFNSKLCMAVCLLSALALLVAWWKSLKNIEVNKRFKFLCTLTIVCSLVFSPHAHTQDYLMLSIPAALLWLESRERATRAGRWTRVFLLALPPITWALYLIDILKPPIPSFLFLAPALVICAWYMFCVPENEQKELVPKASTS